MCLLITWLSYWGVNIMHRQPWCVLSVYLAYVCSFLSVWIVVSFTVERFIIVVFPLQGRNILRVRRAIGVVVGLAIFSILFYSYALFTSKIIDMMGFKQCATELRFMNFLAVMTHTDTVITLIIPSLTIIVLNSLIGCFIYKASKEFNNDSALKFQSGESRFSYSSNTMATAMTELSSEEDSCKEKTAPAVQGNRGLRASTSVSVCSRRNDSKKTARRKHMKSTKMLLIISTVFLLMNLPAHVIRIRQLVLQMMRKYYVPTADEEGIRDLAHLVYYANFAINFFLYSLCGEKFRRCVKNYLSTLTNMCLAVCTTRKSEPDSEAGNPHSNVNIPLKESKLIRRERDTN